jgi:hypothetical protein
VSARRRPARPGRLRNAAAGALLLALHACGPEPDDPEARVRALVARAEAAAEDRDTGALLALLSPRYRDAHGGDRDAARALLVHTFLRHQSVHLLVRLRELRFPAEGRAALTAFVAMAGSPIEGAGALLDLRADLHRFDLELATEEGEWRVVGAAWRQARPADFQD